MASHHWESCLWGAMSAGALRSPSSAAWAPTARTGSRTGCRSHSMETLGHHTSCFIIQSRSIKMSDHCLIRRMHVHFEWAVKPWQALQTWEDTGTTQVARGKLQKKPKTSVCLEDTELRANSMCRLCAGELLIPALWNGWVWHSGWWQFVHYLGHWVTV